MAINDFSAVKENILFDLKELVYRIVQKNEFQLANINILDCTLRDGGYYNNWDFPANVVQNYLECMSDAHIDYIEIGLRALQTDRFLGAHAFTKESYISQFSIPANIKLAVMVNAADLLRSSLGPEHVIDEYFDEKSQSHLSMVRVACHYHEFERILSGLEALHKKGYEVGINLMQVASRTTDEIISFFQKIQNIPISVAYIADSTGSLTPTKVKNILDVIKPIWSGPIGVHMHDNMGLGLVNTLTAISSGATFVDSTITGMGRGAGNVQTEYLINEKKVVANKNINPIPMLKLIEKYFRPLKTKFGWGKNFFYYRAGQSQIHPSYVQEMLEDKRYKIEDIIDAIDYLKKNGKNFDRALMDEALLFNSASAIGSWVPFNYMKDRTVLILASGTSVETYIKPIETFIKNKKPYVIALNTQNSLDDKLVDIRVACHKRRILSDLSQYRNLSSPIVLPFGTVSTAVSSEFDPAKFRDFGLKVVKNKFEFQETGAILPKPLGLAYALAIANSGKVTKIYIAGADGYGSGDSRNGELDDFFSLYIKHEGTAPIFSITPTNLNLRIKSVYAL